jgi:DNA replication protein DnaC
VAIVGPVGSGKTTAAAYVVAVVGDGRLIDAHELFERIHTEHRLYGELATTSVLVVDDLGTEMASEIALVTWHRLVDERYNEGRPIVVTTNLENLGDLFVDERTRSRFMANLRVWRTERGDLRPLMERQEREREASSTDDTGP